MKVIAWEAPWVREFAGAGRRVRFAAAASVKLSHEANGRVQCVLVLPDLGTAPLARFRTPLRRLLQLREQSEPLESAYALHLLVVTTNLDGRGRRQTAWTQHIERLRNDAGLPPVAATVLEWDQVYNLLGQARGAALHRAADYRPPKPSSTRRPRADELLALLGRHPFLRIEQFAALLAVTPRRARQLRQSLVAQGLIRLIPMSEVPTNSLPPREHHSWLNDLAELTPRGRRRLARQLGLPVAAARRHHGLFGGSPRHRHRALRHLAHTIGANQVFVSLALAAQAARALGADEALLEWRPAAACEHWRCKPDGYGCYRRGSSQFGFLLEYDRGSERASQYDAKLAAYYAYRNSGQAERHYADLPHVLFVTISEAAEERIIAAIERAFARHGDQGFSFLTTTTARLEASGVLAPIWRHPAAPGLRLPPSNR